MQFLLVAPDHPVAGSARRAACASLVARPSVARKRDAAKASRRSSLLVRHATRVRVVRGRRGAAATTRGPQVLAPGFEALSRVRPTTALPQIAQRGAAASTAISGARTGRR